MDRDALLSTVPDWGGWAEATRWVEDGIEGASKLSHAAAEAAAYAVTSIRVAPSGRFGCYGQAAWRRAVLATFLADLVSYPRPVDQVTFERLAFVMSSFPEGFRTYWAELGAAWWPVGYSGWYPMLPSAFETFLLRPHELRDRTVVPCPREPSVRPYVYVFNYSVVSPFRKTALSSTLVKQLVSDIGKQRPAGLTTVAVSEDGARVARRLGMRTTGTIVLDGSEESVFAARLE